ncbi:MAG TPA: TetR/AcrR family transcriptional regulator [Sphingobium sp.]|nr:TetR/AcrR family transcriptional regulator [Sphingobium sp.]
MRPVKQAKDKGGRPDSATALRLSQAILDAAERIFLAQGFTGASIEAIATAAGTSKQTLYARFGNKEKLFLAVSERLLKPKFPAQPVVHASLATNLTEAARQILEAMLDPKMVRMYTIINAEAHRFPELAHAADDDRSFPARLLVLQIIEQASASGEIRCDDPRSAMLMFQDMVLATPLRSTALGIQTWSACDLANWGESAVAIFLNGVNHAALK